MRSFVKALLPWKSNKHYIFWVCVCDLSYPARNAHASYSQMWPARLYNIYKTLRSSKDKTYWIWNVCCDFFYSLCLKVKLIFWRRTERDMIRYVYWSSSPAAIILVRFYWALIFLDRVTKKYFKMQFRMFSGSRVVSCGRTDRQTSGS
jgi:hypothetical protein